MASSQVFLDANAIIYALDETSERYSGTVACIQRLLDEDATLCTSHHVIEEVLYIARKIGDTSTGRIVKEIGKIPDLVLVEPDATLAFAERYAELSDRLRMGVNDVLLLQLMRDAGVTRLLSYDKQFVNRADDLGIELVDSSR